MSGFSPNASGVLHLNSIDELVRHALQQKGPLQGTRIQNAYAYQALLPAFKKLDKSGGTATGVSPLQLCTSALQNGKDPLDLLIPQDWTPAHPRPGLAAAYVLMHRLQEESKDVTLVWNKALAYCQIYDCHELILYPQLYTRLAEKIHETAIAAGQEASSVQPLLELLHGMRMAASRNNILTPIHPIFARACLSTRDYSSILPVIDSPVEDFEMAYAPVSVRHFLLYHYYAGCIHAAVQQFSKACLFFEAAITVPGSAASAISLDAYKKLVLCSLVSKGDPPQLPKYTSQPVLSASKSHCSVYGELAQAFYRFEREEVHKLAAEHKDDFTRDGNWGLVLQCLERLQSQAILKLRETFVTVSLQEVAEAVQGAAGPVNDEALLLAETLILGLVQSGELFASIDYEEANSKAGDATVTFLPDPEPYNSSKTVDLLTSKMSASAALGERNIDLSLRMLHDKAFLKKAMSNYSSSGNSMPGFYGGSAMEEDLMDS